MKRILVVEDQDSILTLVKALLNEKGHVVITVKNSLDALDQLKRMPFDMLIADVMLPGGTSGFELVKSLRAEEKFKDFPIMMMTGRRERKDVDKGIEVGADDYVVKPIDPDLFQAKVETLLTKSGGSNKFPYCPVSIDGHWETGLKILGISEVSIHVQSALSAVPGTNARIKSAIFDEIGIEPQLMYVNKCEQRPGAKVFDVHLTFIGLTEKELQPIRMWIRSALRKKAG